MTRDIRRSPRKIFKKFFSEKLETRSGKGFWVFSRNSKIFEFFESLQGGPKKGLLEEPENNAPLGPEEGGGDPDRSGALFSGKNFSKNFSKIFSRNFRNFRKSVHLTFNFRSRSQGCAARASRAHSGALFEKFSKLKILKIFQKIFKIFNFENFLITWPGIWGL